MMTPWETQQIIALLPAAARKNFVFWRTHLEPLLAVRVGIVATLAALSQRAGIAEKTVQKKFYAAKKHGLLALVDKRLAGPDWWRTASPIPPRRTGQRRQTKRRAVGLYALSLALQKQIRSRLQTHTLEDTCKWLLEGHGFKATTTSLGEFLQKQHPAVTRTRQAIRVPASAVQNGFTMIVEAPANAVVRIVFPALSRAR